MSFPELNNIIRSVAQNLKYAIELSGDYVILTHPKMSLTILPYSPRPDHIIMYSRHIPYMINDGSFDIDMLVALTSISLNSRTGIIYSYTNGNFYAFTTLPLKSLDTNRFEKTLKEFEAEVLGWWDGYLQYTKNFHRTQQMTPEAVDQLNNCLSILPGTFALDKDLMIHLRCGDVDLFMSPSFRGEEYVRISSIVSETVDQSEVSLMSILLWNDSNEFSLGMYTSKEKSEKQQPPSILLFADYLLPFGMQQENFKQVISRFIYSTINARNYINNPSLTFQCTLKPSKFDQKPQCNEQYYFECLTCNIVGSIGVCVSCRYRCHQSCTVIAKGPMNFYCDCPATYPKCPWSHHASITFIDLFNSQIFTNETIKCKNGEVRAHDFIVDRGGDILRTGLKDFDVDTANIILSFFYGDLEPINKSNNSTKPIVNDFISSIGNIKPLSQYMGTLISNRNNDYGYVQLETNDGNVIYVLKAVLCNYEYFRTIYQCGMEESLQDILPLDINYQEAQLLVNYIYTGCLEDATADDLSGLLIESHKYMMEGLTYLCETKLAALVNEDNALQIYSLVAVYSNIVKAVCWYRLKKKPNLTQEEKEVVYNEGCEQCEILNFRSNFNGCVEMAKELVAMNISSRASGLMVQALIGLNKMEEARRIMDNVKEWDTNICYCEFLYHLCKQDKAKALIYYGASVKLPNIEFMNGPPYKVEDAESILLSCRDDNIQLNYKSIIGDVDEIATKRTNRGMTNFIMAQGCINACRDDISIQLLIEAMKESKPFTFPLAEDTYNNLILKYQNCSYSSS